MASESQSFSFQILFSHVATCYQTCDKAWRSLPKVRQLRWSDVPKPDTRHTLLTSCRVAALSTSFPPPSRNILCALSVFTCFSQIFLDTVINLQVGRSFVIHQQSKGGLNMNGGEQSLECVIISTITILLICGIFNVGYNNDYMATTITRMTI